MMTTHALSKLAAIGTRHSINQPQATDEAVDSLLRQLGSDREVAKLLIAVASEKLRQKAGYRPQKMQPESLDACEKLSSRTLRDAEALAHLKQMVIPNNGDLELPDWLLEATEPYLEVPKRYLVLPEWCLYLALSGQHAPEELVPHLLNYGSKVEVAQEFLMMIMGDRARWMSEALKRPEWDWATYLPVQNASTLAVQERWKERYIIDDFYDGTHNIDNHPSLTELANLYYSIWSGKLTDTFLYFVKTKVKSFKSLRMYHSGHAIRETLIEAVVRFPLNRTDDLLQIFEGWEWHQKEITHLFDFRRNMIKAIYRDTSIANTKTSS